jgi:serpin B
MLRPLIACLAFTLLVGSAARGAENEKEESPVSSDNGFAVNLYVRLASTPGNLFFSPYSIRTALAMTYAGAGGETATQMAAVLRLPDVPAEQLHTEFASLIKQLNTGGKDNYQLAVANALWGQSGFDFRPEFKELLRTSYGADLREVDFVHHAEEVRGQINQWAEEATRGKIKDLIAPGVLDPITRLVLANAIYFKAAWDDPFSEHATQDGPFHLDARNDVQVKLMHHSPKTWEYNETDQVQVLEVPYQGGDMSMVLVVPKAVDRLPTIEQSLTGDTVRQWLSSRKPQLVSLTMPKFTTTSQFELGKTLAAMGMPDAFDSNRANFSGMTLPDQQKTEPLFIGAVIHKAFVAADEKGTEAAAATAVVMRAGSAMMRPKEPIAVTADRPFLYFIYHRASGSVLFLGRLSDPRS